MVVKSEEVWPMGGRDKVIGPRPKNCLRTYLKSFNQSFKCLHFYIC